MLYISSINLLTLRKTCRNLGYWFKFVHYSDKVSKNGRKSAFARLRPDFKVSKNGRKSAFACLRPVFLFLVEDGGTDAQDGGSFGDGEVIVIRHSH